MERSKNSSQSSEHEKPKSFTFRAHPFNKKIFQALYLDLSKRVCKDTSQFSDTFYFPLSIRTDALAHALIWESHNMIDAWRQEVSIELIVANTFSEKKALNSHGKNLHFIDSCI